VALRLRFWGTRGSVPAPGPHTARFGGNTPCLELRSGSGALVVLDAGTGARALGIHLVAEARGVPITGDVFVTHLHWDHVQGIPFFEPLFSHGNRFVIHGPRALDGLLEQAVRAQMASPYFPVSFDTLPAQVTFAAIPEVGLVDRATLGYAVRAFDVRHPDHAVGYRVTCTESARAMAYVPDNEIACGASDERWRDRLLDHLRGAELLVHDAMYSADEVGLRRGWGHSSHVEATALAIDAGVATLALFHHHPDRSDAEIDALVGECERLVSARGSSLRVIAAAEGLVLDV
jgi:phosphoribosyl 1,2-cyclic phosphodiesterase